MLDAVQVYCATARELTQLQEKARADLRDVREAKKAAQAVLLELHDGDEAVCELPEGTFCVRVKTSVTRPPQPVSILEQMEAFWEDAACAAWQAELERDPALDPIDAFVERVVALSWPEPVVKRALDLRPAKGSAARLQDLPAAPATSTELVANVVAAKAFVAEQMTRVKEDKKRLAEALATAERSVVPELAQLPSGVVRKVSFGEEEAFFLRLKPPRKAPPMKVSCAKVRKRLKALLAERVTLPSREAVIARLVDPAFGAALLRDAAAHFEADAQPANAAPRVAMDRLRSCA